MDLAHSGEPVSIVTCTYNTVLCIYKTCDTGYEMQKCKNVNFLSITTVLPSPCGRYICLVGLPMGLGRCRLQVVDTDLQEVFHYDYAPTHKSIEWSASGTWIYLLLQEGTCIAISVAERHIFADLTTFQVVPHPQRDDIVALLDSQLRLFVFETQTWKPILQREFTGDWIFLNCIGSCGDNLSLAVIEWRDHADSVLNLVSLSDKHDNIYSDILQASKSFHLDMNDSFVFSFRDSNLDIYTLDSSGKMIKKELHFDQNIISARQMLCSHLLKVILDASDRRDRQQLFIDSTTGEIATWVPHDAIDVSPDCRYYATTSFDPDHNRVISCFRVKNKQLLWSLEYSTFYFTGQDCCQAVCLGRRIVHKIEDPVNFVHVNENETVQLLPCYEEPNWQVKSAAKLF